MAITEFQSTLPREERPGKSVRLTKRVYFNPRSHERSDEPAFRFMYFSINFNPRSHERSDGSRTPRRRKHLEFQSTLPREERRYFETDSDGVEWISIHAPTRGATDSYNGDYYYQSISIHAPTRGATKTGETTAMKCPFQSTLPREERRDVFAPVKSSSEFQSTLPREERRNAAWTSSRYSEFQSTLPREERRR